MKKRHRPPGGEVARYDKVGAAIIPFPASPEQERQRDWLRLVRACRSPADWQLVHEHRARLAYVTATLTTLSAETISQAAGVK